MVGKGGNEGEVGLRLLVAKRGSKGPSSNVTAASTKDAFSAPASARRTEAVDVKLLAGLICRRQKYAVLVKHHRRHTGLVSLEVRNYHV
jgi:hypothetical protein